MRLEKMLAVASLYQLVAEKVVEEEIVRVAEDGSILPLDSEGGEVEVRFRLSESIPSRRIRRYKLSPLLRIWDSLGDLYLIWLGTRMLREGYVYASVEGGEIISSPLGEVYQLNGDECTCLSHSCPCKHLLFRDFHRLLGRRSDDLRRAVMGN